MENKTKYFGFGFAPEYSKHHFLIDIPQSKDEDVKVYERYRWDESVTQISELPEDTVYRSNCKIEIAHGKWDILKPSIESFFNKKLKYEQKTTARFSIGQNIVEEDLGKEMLVLLWAVKDKVESDFATALINWKNLSSEERLWLYAMTNMSITRNDDNKGWRMALSYAISEKHENSSPDILESESGCSYDHKEKTVLKRPASCFGFEPEECQHHFLVRIPNITKDANDVIVYERFVWDDTDRNNQKTGIACTSLVNPNEKIVLSREKWEAVKPVIEANLNSTLQRTGRKTGKFMNGNNAVERLLGKEMMVLLWAIEGCDISAVDNAILNWQALSREEKWWLFTMTNATTGSANDKRGWRMALRYALTENPIQDQGPSNLFENIYK